MNIELIPIVVFAWFVGFTQLIESNFGLLFFTPFVAIVWALAIIAIMRRWETK